MSEKEELEYSKLRVWRLWCSVSRDSENDGGVAASEQHEIQVEHKQKKLGTDSAERGFQALLVAYRS